MHKLKPKGKIPKCLSDFCQKEPGCRDWKSFYDNYNDSYKELKEIIASNQDYLCAYCEERLPAGNPSLQRIEHFHPKEDFSPEHNWAFDWNNMLVTCHGGSRKDAPPPLELHCDACKEQKVTPSTCEGYLLNPLTMPAQCLFSLDLATGKLLPDETVCSRITLQDNHYASVQELVEETIRILNLNCDRLIKNRCKIICEFEKERNRMRQNPKENKVSIRRAIARKWFKGKTPSFFTTRRILLGKYAEEIIQDT